MGIIEIGILKITRNGRTPMLPKRQSADAAAFDVHAFLDAPVCINPGGRALIPTGLRLELPSGCMALLLARSGLALKSGISLANGVGLIDADYRGEVMVGLINLGDGPFTVHDGERVAQLLLMGGLNGRLVERQTLGQTARGERGFGSTGLK